MMPAPIVTLMTIVVVATMLSPALGQTIKIGASISLTGPMSREGYLLKEGYDFWLDHVNQQGGIVVGGKRHTVQIVFMTTNRMLREPRGSPRGLSSRTRFNSSLARSRASSRWRQA